ncbi:MAG: hypothetical protein N3Z28_12560 [Synechococcaceae cyanobacterium MAG-AL2]|uniref:hypothetical protein n=1 Tax=Candidatus Regnicoccus frigidus TaxID=3074015 RepID=UPI002819EDDD|nr:hypothetical protein [Candidatus Regnicoccus frigidus]MCT4368482.1 hypothetical protein [Candidatus Regnicoccus frigidus MAG-AL2]
MAVQLCAYIVFVDASGTPQVGYAWQNFWAGQLRSYDGRDHVFMGFRISDSAGARGGDRSQGELRVNRNQLALNVLAEARANAWKIRADIVVVDVVAGSDVRLLSRHNWRLGPIERQASIRVQLTSPLDAVRGDAPRRRLSTELVGQVPDTGSLFIA